MINDLIRNASPINLITTNGYHIRGVIEKYVTYEDSNTDSSIIVIRDWKSGMLKYVFEHAVSTIELVDTANTLSTNCELQ